MAIAAAVAAYFKFVRGRTFQPRLTLAITGEITDIHGAPALVVEVDVKNDGQSGVVLDPCYSQSLDIFILDEPVWNDAVSSADGVVLWFDGLAPHRRIEVLDDPGLLPYQSPMYRDAAAPTPSSFHGSPEYKAPPGNVLAGYVLEPGEREHRTLLVPVDKASAYLLQLSIRACGHAGVVGKQVHRRCRSRRRTPDMWQSRSIFYEDDR